MIRNRQGSNSSHVQTGRNRFDMSQSKLISRDFFNLQKIYPYLILYFIFLLLIAPINILSLDTYYYWDWSRHLALSYYDGSPMIAYFIRLSTSLFGHNLFALCFVGITITAVTCGIIYKCGRFFYPTKQAASQCCHGSFHRWSPAIY